MPAVGQRPGAVSRRAVQNQGDTRRVGDSADDPILTRVANLADVLERRDVAVAKVVDCHAQRLLGARGVAGGGVAVAKLQQAPGQEGRGAGHGEVDFERVSCIVPPAHHAVGQQRGVDPGDRVAGGDGAAALRLVKRPAGAQGVGVGRLVGDEQGPRRRGGRKRWQRRRGRRRGRRPRRGEWAGRRRPRAWRRGMRPART